MTSRPLPMEGPSMGKNTRAGELSRPATSLSKALRRGRSVRGFTLAGLLVLVSIVMIFVAYTVPKQWSAIMQRERELQTIYVMRQYARGCNEFQRKHNIWPSSIDQLKDARLPRFLRGGPKGEIVDPLTGQVDWLVVPASAGGATTSPGGTAVVNGGGGNIGVGAGPPTASSGNTTTNGGSRAGKAGTTDTQRPPAPAGLRTQDYRR